MGILPVSRYYLHPWTKSQKSPYSSATVLLSKSYDKVLVNKIYPNIEWKWVPLYCNISFFIPLILCLDDVKSLSLPGTYHEKISSLGTSLTGFTRLKSLDLSRNALLSTEVTCFFFLIGSPALWYTLWAVTISFPWIPYHWNFHDTLIFIFEIKVLQKK